MVPTREDKYNNLVRLLAAERKRNGEVQGHLNALLKVQKRYITTLNKQIEDVQSAYVIAIAAQFKITEKR